MMSGIQADYILLAFCSSSCVSRRAGRAEEVTPGTPGNQTLSKEVTRRIRGPARNVMVELVCQIRRIVGSIWGHHDPPTSDYPGSPSNTWQARYRDSTDSCHVTRWWASHHLLVPCETDGQKNRTPATRLFFSANHGLQSDELMKIQHQ